MPIRVAKAVSNSDLIELRDEANNFTSKNVEGALAEVGTQLTDIKTTELSYNLYNKDSVTVKSYIKPSGDIAVTQDVRQTNWVTSGLIDVGDYESFVNANCAMMYLAFFVDQTFIERISYVAKNTVVSLTRGETKANKIRVNYDITTTGYNTVMVYGGSDTGKEYVPYGETYIVKKSKESDHALEAGSITKKYTGKKVLILGDSIMTYKTTVGKVAENIETILESSLLVDVAVAGATWTDTTENMVYDGNPTTSNQNVLGNQVQKLINGFATNPDYAEFDICIIGAGTNDGMSKFGWSDGVWVAITDDAIEAPFTGNASAFDINPFIDVDTVDRTTLSGAMRWTAEKLYSLYPNLKIYISLPIQAAPTWRTHVGTANKDKLIARIAERMSLTCVDTQNCGIYARYEIKDTNGKYLSDGLHPNADGGLLVAEYICKRIKEYYSNY